MTTDQVSERDGRLWLTLTQEKTGELVDVPCHRDLEPLPRERLAEKSDTRLLVPSPRGKRWQRRHFARAWDQTIWRFARKLLGEGLSKDAIRPRLLSGVQRRDLRRTGMVRMAEAGATVPQIAAVSGHSIDQTARIIDTYVPRRGDVAAKAIEAWEGGFQNSAVVLETGNRPPVTP